MKKLWWKNIFGMFVWAWIGVSSQIVTAAVSVPLIIPGSQPVRVKLANTNEYIEATFMFPFLPGTEITQGDYNVLCPDLTTIRSVTAGNTFEACPPLDPNVMIVQTDPFGGWWPPRTPGTGKPVGECDNLNKQLVAAQIPRTDPTFNLLLGDCYFESQQYQDAGIFYDNAVEFFQESKAQEQQAIAHYKLSRAYWERGKKNESIREAQNAVELHKRGYAAWKLEPEEAYYCEQIQQATEKKDEDGKVMAQHQLAILEMLRMK